MKHIDMLLSQFPGASNQDYFTSDEIKRLFYQAIPTNEMENEFHQFWPEFDDNKHGCLAHLYGAAETTNRRTEEEKKGG